MDRLLRATLNTWNGLLAAASSEEAFRQELVVLALAVPLAFFIGTANWKPLTLIAVLLGVLVVELLNTAIEKLSDFVAPARDERIGRIKDMGSAAVGLAIIAAGLFGYRRWSSGWGGFDAALPPLAGASYSCLISPASIKRRLNRRASAPPLQA